MDGGAVRDAVVAAEPPRRVAFEFTGTAREYFGIWAVNLLLTVATLGIWGAWATVRRNRWFWGHTALDGHAFEYTAKGWQILVGRLVALAMFVAVLRIDIREGSTLLLMLPVIVLALPFLINRGTRFGARATRWRGIAFDFSAGYGATLGLVVLLPALEPLTLFLAVPFADRIRARYYAERVSFGGLAFRSDPRLPSLWLAFLLTAVAFCFGLALIGLAIGFMFAYRDAYPPPPGEEAPAAIAIPLYIAFWAAGWLTMVVRRVTSGNVILSSLSLDDRHRFHSTVPTLGYLWMVISGGIATILSLGFLAPWAAVREWRYLWAHRGATFDGAIEGATMARPGTGDRSLAGRLGELGGADFAA